MKYCQVEALENERSTYFEKFSIEFESKITEAVNVSLLEQQVCKITFNNYNYRSLSKDMPNLLFTDLSAYFCASLEMFSIIFM